MSADEELEATKAQLAALAQAHRATLLDGLGLDPDSEHAAALVELHGDGELTAEALAATASEFGFTADAADVGGGGVLTEAQSAALKTQQRIDGLMAAGAPISAEGPVERLRAEAAEAEASGDLPRMIATQNALLQEWRRSRGLPS